MIEYLYNAIRAVAGQPITVAANITTEEGECIDSGCKLVLHNPDGSMLAAAIGVFNTEEEIWEFTIPANATFGLNGRYWYCIQHNDNNLCFKEPIYLI